MRIRYRANPRPKVRYATEPGSRGRSKRKKKDNAKRVAAGPHKLSAYQRKRLAEDPKSRSRQRDGGVT